MAFLFPIWSTKKRLWACPRVQGLGPCSWDSRRGSLSLKPPLSECPWASYVWWGMSQSGLVCHTLTMVEKLHREAAQCGPDSESVLLSCSLHPVAGAEACLLVPHAAVSVLSPLAQRAGLTPQPSSQERTLWWIHGA